MSLKKRGLEWHRDLSLAAAFQYTIGGQDTYYKVPRERAEAVRRILLAPPEHR